LSSDILDNRQAVNHPKWLSLVLGLILAIWFLGVIRDKIIELNEAALGGQTTAVLAEADGMQVSCFDAADTLACENAYQRAGRPPAILWFGNSQNFAINRYKPGDQLAVVTVHRWLEKRGKWLVSYTQPNANLHEEALLFEALTHRYNTRLVILPVFMDKLREQGIREGISAFLNDPKTSERVRASPEWSDISSLLTKDTNIAPETTIQQTVEKKVNETLDAYWPLWRDRSKLRANLGFAIHILRNKLMGIHSYTKRPVDARVYEEKLRVLEKLLENAEKRGIRILLYIPPYRHDIPGPYDELQYAKFKKDIAALAAKYKADFANLDELVPGPEWATVVDTLFGFEEPDFMHFTAEGHARLAAAMQRRLEELGF
jgi:hypothetical protein